MRILLLSSFALALLAAPAVAQTKINVRRAATSTVSVRLSGAFAKLSVEGWDRDSVEVTGAVGAGSRFEGGGYGSSGPAPGMKFFVEASEQANTAANVIQMRVPRTARVWIKAGSAEIECQSVSGGLDLNIVGGSIKVNGKPRELLVESMDGSIYVFGHVTYGRLKTATGDITMDGRGEDLSFTTVSGTVTLNNRITPVERARFESVTGPIAFGGDIARGGDVRFDTHSGAIDLRLPAKSAIEIDAATITGSIENSWNHQRPIAGREGRGMELGTANAGGGARVQIRSFKGNVRVSAAAFASK